MPVVLGMGVASVLVGLVFLCVGEPLVPVLFDGCFMFGCPEGLGGGDVLKTGGTELCDDGLGVLPNVE